ncbi:MAG: error-prone DNA polymerase [Lysobacteraceae bacterium]|nr:MAG: error-prone DNA polymerase [Xanthomonadaceae bacterium]
MNSYVELHALSNFSFQRGASSAAELFERAQALGYSALAITDECSLAGIVRAYEASKKTGLKLIVGSEVTLSDGPRLVILAQNHQGYSQLCELITRGRRAASKGSYQLARSDLSALPGCLLLWLPENEPNLSHGQWLAQRFQDKVWIAVELHRQADDAHRLSQLQALGEQLGLPLVAAGDVHMHCRSRRALQDTMTAIRHGVTLDEAGTRLFANGERHLRSLQQLSELYPAPLLTETLRIARQCQFDLGALNYHYPNELVPNGLSAIEQLRELTRQGLRKRWPQGADNTVKQLLRHELELIEALDYAPFFLTVHDVVAFARSRNILCQGRGSAANSAVCYCLGITEVDPARMNMLFERFISKERNEPPDIDVDFEHQRREEVIQYIYHKYGRHRAALAATVITYRTKSAVRDVGKALGMTLDQVDLLTRAVSHWDRPDGLPERLQERGFDPESPLIKRLLYLVGEIMGFPRHLSQHVGGFVISEHPLSTLVPVENASMAERTIIQWDKDDLETLGLLKVDVLALGMLSAIRRCFDLIGRFHGSGPTFASVPAEDPRVYEMIQRADTIGVFQIESRAQMSMLPRLKPACFYDLVIEVAIVRPGPIQGKMVHPYLRRRQGLEPVSYASKDLEKVLKRTLGIPLFQEQVMELAVVAAGFTPGEADQLRRSMAAWKRRGGLDYFERRLIGGMLERGYEREFAEQVFEQIKGFGSYGFPESHAASFALLVYVSCWLKCHHPAAFTCALLNSLPMGFYSASQLVQDVQRHDVEVRPPDVCFSDYDCTLEKTDDGQAAIRLGLRQIKGLKEEVATRIVSQRCQKPFSDVQQLTERAKLDRGQRQRLADGGALRTLSGHRHQARWAVDGVEELPPLLKGSQIEESRAKLRTPTASETVLTDYDTLGLSLEAHPLELLRSQLKARRVLTSREVDQQPNGRPLRAAGLVTLRQRPGTASGVTFLTLEDETGMLNVVVWAKLGEQQRRELLESTLLAVDGIIEREQGVQHLIAHRLHNYNDILGQLHIQARNFC